MKQQKELFLKYGFSDRQMEIEKKRYEKLQRAIEKKEAKILTKELKRFAGKKEDWL